MQEISVDQVNEVSGGNIILVAAVGWFVGKVLDAGVRFVVSNANNGGHQDFGRMTAMGDAY